MKRRLFVFFVMFLFFSMLLFPKPVFNGASSGILLWFQIVLPTLLPFILVSGLMIHTNAIYYISRMTGPVLGKLLGVSGCGSFAVLAGFLCGYPMGAKVTAELLRTGQISQKEAGYLLSFCNNTSPMFIISYLVLQNVKEDSFLLPSVLILIFAPVACSFFFRKRYQKGKKFPIRTSLKKQSFSLDILDSCMMDSFEAITKVGGYIMLFSILIQLAGLLPWSHLPGVQVLLASLEITNGIPMMLSVSASLEIGWMLSMGLSAFGGFCAAAQTSSMIQGTGLNLGTYLIEKGITAGVTCLFCAGYLWVAG